ncbi:DUF1624 domain-containing protein [Dactylosporangium sp. NBC_01737]|uniref:heparan-alpha-glucosaminide N-acetyltransferase domain-containing protein n=1 Tax=Dactylosporangium sp. NBC_01737 TaxID=2975959 RepID=UPI002E106C38|nr:DUF1624 domain-containing protein [Dactylosporangium sp. NBC_01737]
MPASSVSSSQAPATKQRARLLGVDAARGVSLLGMITLHSLYESDAAGNPTWSDTVFSGRAAAAFAVLAGVGVALATGRRRVRPADARSTVALLAVRALTIGAIGLLLGAADSMLNAVILAYLAVVFLLAIPLVFLPTWAVAAIGVTLLTAGPAGAHLLLPHLPQPELVNPTFAWLFDDPVGLVTELTLTGFYPSPAWLAYMSVGVVIGRLNLARARVAVTLLTGGTVLAVASGAASWLLLHRYHGLDRIWAAQPASGVSVERTNGLLKLGGNGNTPSSTWWWLAIDAPHTSTPLDLLGTTSTAVAVLGLLLLIGRLRHRVGRWLAGAILVPLAAAGSMTLTFYAAHVLFINSDDDTYSATTGCLVQLIAVVLIALAIRYTVGRGPLEAIVIVLATRGRRMASRRPAPVAGPVAGVEAAVTIPAQRSKATVTPSAARDAALPVNRPATTPAAPASPLRKMRMVRRRRHHLRRSTRHRARTGRSAAPR